MWHQQRRPAAEEPHVRLASGAPVPSLAAIVAIVEFFVGLAIVLGAWTRPLALLLALYTLGTALIGHHFWTMEGAERFATKR